jgi:hypothetical protein
VWNLPAPVLVEASCRVPLPPHPVVRGDHSERFRQRGSVGPGATESFRSTFLPRAGAVAPLETDPSRPSLFFNVAIRYKLKAAAGPLAKHGSRML